MAVAGLAVTAVVVLALLVGVHRYLWRRFVGDTTAEGSALRRTGAVAACLLPLLTIGALVSGRTGAPFWLQRVLAWPGYLWLAALLYLTLALLVGEAARPILRRVLAGRAKGSSRSNRPSVTKVLTPEAADAPAADILVADAPAADTLAVPTRRLFVARAVGVPQPSPDSARSATARTACCAGRGSSGSPSRSPSCPAPRTASGSPSSATSTSARSSAAPTPGGSSTRSTGPSRIWSPSSGISSTEPSSTSVRPRSRWRN